MTTLAGPCLFLFAHDSFSSRMAQGLFDDTFSGIYRLSAFDWALLIPYFTILAILSVYDPPLRNYSSLSKVSQ